MNDLKCAYYGFTMIDKDGNVLPYLSDYNKHCSMIVIGNIQKMLNIPPEYVTGDDCYVPNLITEILTGKENAKVLDYHGRVYIAIPDNDCLNPHFMEITNQVKTLQLQVITYFPKKKE